VERYHYLCNTPAEKWTDGDYEWVSWFMTTGEGDTTIFLEDHSPHLLEREPAKFNFMFERYHFQKKRPPNSADEERWLSWFETTQEYEDYAYYILGEGVSEHAQ
jgi:hypothetical protein